MPTPPDSEQGAAVIDFAKRLNQQRLRNALFEKGRDAWQSVVSGSNLYLQVTLGDSDGKPFSIQDVDHMRAMLEDLLKPHPLMSHQVKWDTDLSCLVITLDPKHLSILETKGVFNPPTTSRRR